MNDIDYILKTAHDEDELDPAQWPETTQISVTTRLYRGDPSWFLDAIADINDRDRERLLEAYSKYDYAEIGRIMSDAWRKYPLNWMWSQIEDHYWTWRHHRRHAEAADREWDRIREDEAIGDRP